MRGQERPGWCGPAAVSNAARCVGPPVAQRRVAKLAGTTTEGGTDEHGLLAALSALGMTGEPWQTRDKKRASEWLLWRSAGCPIILCVDHWLHWVAVIGRCGEKVIIVDKERAKHSGSHVQAVRLDKLMRRWKATAEDGRGYYAITVHRD